MFVRNIFGAALLTGATLASTSAYAAGTASFIVVHGIPGKDVGPTVDPKLPVDVLVNGSLCLLKGLTFGQITKAVKVPAGTYSLAISLANATTPCSNAAVINASATLRANSKSSIVASLSAAGTPTVQIFPVDVSTVTKGNIRIIAAHAAAAPNVQLTGFVPRFGGGFFQATLRTGRFRDIPTHTNDYSINLTDPKSTNSKAIATTVIRGKDQNIYALYAVGSVTNGTVKVLQANITKRF